MSGSLVLSLFRKFQMAAAEKSHLHSHNSLSELDEIEMRLKLRLLDALESTAKVSHVHDSSLVSDEVLAEE